MSKEEPYLIRGSDGVLQVNSKLAWRAEYQDPGEAVKTWWAGKLRFGCAERQFSNHRDHPCGKTPKHDPDHNGNFTRCGNHSKATKDRRDAKQRAKREAEKAKWEFDSSVREHRAEMPGIIQQIADGHNDPRGLCQSWLDRKPTKDDT